MAKFCGRCGARLDSEGYCPNRCDGRGRGAAAPQPLSRKEQRALRKQAKHDAKKAAKQAKRDAKKAAKRAKRAAMTTGQKVGRFFLKLLGILLALAVLAAAAACALVYFEIVDIPVVSNIMGKFIRTDAVETTDFQLLEENAISRKVTDQESARQALEDIAPQLGIKDAEKELGECREDAVLGNTYYRFPQEYQGIPVYGRSVVVVADSAGNGTLVSGNLKGVGKLDTKPTISESEVSDFARAYYNSEEFSCGVEELVIYSLNDREPTLAWQALVEADGEVEYCFVDAKTGDVLGALSQNYTEQAQCSGHDIDDVNQTFFAEYTGDLYVMEDTSKDITVYDANNSTLEIQWQVVDENGKFYTAKNGEWVDESGKSVMVKGIEGENFNLLILNDKGEVIGKNGEYAVRLKTKNIFTTVSPVTSKTTLWNNKKAVTVMSRVSLVDDFWAEVFHRKGYDNGYGAIVAVFDDNKGMDTTNASSHGGSGFPITILSFGTDNSLSLNVIAHEYTHSVEKSISHMAYQGESGALMEAYSDIFGEIVEDWANDGVFDGDCDWIFDVYRNLRYPALSETPLPSSYQGTYWKNTADLSREGDHGGVHTNNTVISHAAYLMWKGIDGSDSFEALTTEELAKLFYATLYTLPEDCTFSQFRTLTQHTARTMNFTEKQLRCISNAFFQVGIPETELPVAKTISLDVLFVDGTPDYDYTVYVRGNGTEQTYTSATVEAEGLEFPDVGNFEITVIDNTHDYIQGSRLVRVTATGGVEKLTMTIADKVKEEKSSIPADAVEFNSHYYYLYDVDNTWENAQAYCEAVGGYLAAITSQEENEFLYNYMRQRGYDSAYFGLSNTQNGTWQWSSGEALSYINWHSGEPNNESNSEHYGMFYWKYPDGTWNDGKFDAADNVPMGERRDIVRSVTASSYLPAGDTASYEPANVLDGDPATAWAEAKGAGETISFAFDDSYRIGGIVISAGYQQSDELYEANSRPARLRVTGDNGFEQLCALDDLNDRQEIVFDRFTDTRMLSITIEEVYEGGDYTDTCISEVAFLVGGQSGNSDGGTAFLCEWGDPEGAGEKPNGGGQPQTTETASERSIALVLDTSGSMSGTPINETRKAASNFVFSVLQQSASVGVVTYSSSAEVRTDFTLDSSRLEEIVSGLGASGGTNIDDGLTKAYEMLQRTSSKKKIIILMSDGEPNEGRTDEELIAFADEIKRSGVYIYTLGFFDALGNRTSAQYLMEQLASEGCHYEVSSADDLVFFFEDIAGQINGQKYIYIRIACPVDVTVTYDGETLTSAADDLNTRTDFGTLTFEDSERSGDNSQADQVKILRLKEGVDYDVQITGTGYGKMDYTIGFMDDEGEYSDLRRFEDIKITRNTVIDTTAKVSDESVLKVDTDGDGKYDLAYRAGQNEYARQAKVIDWLLVGIIGAGAAALLVVVLVVIRKIKKRKVR